MSERTNRPAPFAIAGVYFFAFLLFFWPLTDLVTTSFPPQPGAVEWRYGFLGLAAAFLHTPTLGILLAMVTAYYLRHTRTLRVLSVVCLAGAAFMFLVMIVFALDVIQMRAVTAPAARSAFQAGALIAEGKHFTAFLAFALLGLGGWKTARRQARRGKSSASKGRTSDVVEMPQPKRRGEPAESADG